MVWTRAMRKRADAIKIIRRRPITVVKRKTRKAKSENKVATVAAVKRIVAKGRENKMVSHLIERTFHNSAISNGDFYPVVPQLIAGPVENQRIGDTVQPKGLYISGEIFLNTSAAFSSNNPIRVRMFIVQYKPCRNVSDALARLNPATLLRSNDDSGGPSTSQYTGGVSEHPLPVNKEAWKVYKDISFTLCPDNQSLTVNDGSPLYRASKFFKMKIPVPKSLTYDNLTTGNYYPENFAPLMAIGYCFPDGTLPDGTATKIGTNFRSYLYYEDA